MMRFNSRKGPLLLGVAMMPLAFAPVADAQQADADQDPAVQETVLVTGYRASNQASVRAKEDAEGILDAISHDDIGRLPDLNVVETARRVVGLSTVGGQDPTKSRDIYQRVTIRGLDPKYNLITVDGVPLASGEWTVRGARLEQFPSSLVSRIEAIKTITADKDPHGLGGQLNIVSRSAFDARGDRFFVFNGSVGENSTAGSFLNDDEPNWRADSTGSIVFGDRDQFGLTVSGEYQKLWSAVNSELPGDTGGNGWAYYTAAGGQTPFANLSADGVLIAVRPQDFRFDNERTRYSLNGKFEYRLNDTDTVSLFAGYYNDEDTEFRAEVLTLPGSGVPTNVTETRGTLPIGQLAQGIVLQPQERETLLFTGKGDFELSPSLDLSLTASYSDATYDEQRIFHKWASSVPSGRVAVNNTADYGYSYIISGGSPLATHNSPTLGLDPDNYQLLYIRDIRRDVDSDVTYLNGQLAWNADKDDAGFGVRFGAAYTETHQVFDTSYTELTSADDASQAEIGGLGNFIYPQTFSSIAHAQIPYLVINPQLVLDYVDANPDLFVATNRTASNFADDYDDLEKVSALYAQGLYQSDKWSIIAGLRYDSTNVEVKTYQVPTTVGSSDYERFTRESSYDFLLPSVIATYHINDDMRITASASKSIGRPDFEQYAAQTRYSIGTAPGQLTISTSNPDLEPREANNFDLSYEWYLPLGGLFSAAAFYKDISNEIFTGTQEGPDTTYLGVTYDDVTVVTPLNSASGEIQGLEFNYTQNSFGFLPEALSGLGINTNLTLLDGSFELPVSSAGQANGQAENRTTSGLIQQPDYIFNGTLFYTAGPVEARVSYNKIGRALQAANQDTPERDLYQEPREQIDAQLRWNLRDDFSLVLQGQNLTEEPFEVRQGPGRAYLNNLFPVGRVIWIGFSWTPDF